MANLNVILEISSETMNGEKSYYDVIRTFENTGGLVVGNLYLTLSGLAFLAIGYYKRNKPYVHKRAMFGVSGLLLNPAFDRFIDPLGLQDIHPLLKFTVIYLFPISLIIYDIVKRKKPYKISVVILIVFLLTLPIIFSLLNAGWGEKLIRFFG
ncbi:hypothetical protein [Aegicerativicinus sediminis]|uniref:hypothetical protein n=1 Tax=Aegicerativicinus sediminis TaxID=2893202 RepID=UPI001E53D152|nr:hypothetical protein [Aegicerativicinus sediminis]